MCFLSKSKSNSWPSVTLWNKQDPIWESLTTQTEGLQATPCLPGHSSEPLSPCVPASKLRTEEAHRIPQGRSLPRAIGGCHGPWA